MIIEHNNTQASHVGLLVTLQQVIFSQNEAI
jgi:hypothetical protein